MPLALRLSPSLLPCNLSYSSMRGGGYRICYIHKDDLIIAESKNGTGIEKSTRLDVTQTQIFHAAYIGFGLVDSTRDVGGPVTNSPMISVPKTSFHEYLVVTSNLGVQLWSADGERLEWFLKMTEELEETNEAPQFHFMRGACSLTTSTGTNCIAVGSSIGTLLIVTTSGDVIHRLSTSSSSPITAVAATPRYLFCANDEGDILGFRCDGTFENFMRIQGKGDCCSALVCKDGVVVAAFSTGHVRIYRAELGELSIEIAAHSRAMTGMALHPHCAYLATCGEDQNAHVWTFPDFLSPSGSDMDLAYSSKLENCLCTGVAWTADQQLLVASYDSEDLHVFHPSSV